MNTEIDLNLFGSEPTVKSEIKFDRKTDFGSGKYTKITNPPERDSKSAGKFKMQMKIASSIINRPFSQ
jgi:uncharacterized protein (DUF2132 family)